MRRYLGRFAVLAPRASTGSRVLVGQPLHKGDGRVPGPADLVTDGIEGPCEALEVI
jgi:hypothetical protein